MITEYVGKCLLEQGYQKRNCDIRGIEVYVGTYDYASHLIAICAPSLTDEIDTWHLVNMKNEIIKSFGISQVKFLIYTMNPTATTNRLSGNHDHWVYDVMQEELLIPYEEPQEYYGLRRAIEKAGTLERTEQTIRVNQKRTSFRILSFTNLIIVLNLLVFVVGLIVYQQQGYDVFKENGAIFTKCGTDLELWRMVTAMFLHADIIHIAGNMISLFFLGNVLEQLVGHWKFLLLYMVGGILGNVVAFTYYNTSVDGPVSLVGASGAVFAIIGAYLYVLIRNRKNISGFTIPRFLLFIGINVYSGVTNPEISMSAHIGGLVSGLILALMIYRKNEGDRVW